VPELPRDSGRYDYSPITDRPAFAWPAGSGLAAYVAINVECFAYGGGGATLTPGADPPHSEHRRYGWRDYGIRVGLWRLLDELAQRAITPTFLLNAYVPQLYPAVAAALTASGGEIVGHGRTNSELQGGLDEADERELIDESTRLLTDAFGTRPYGWMSPGATQSPQTPDLLAENGYRYTLDWPIDDQPVWLRTRGGPLLNVPYPLETNDYPQVLSRGHTGREFGEIALDQLVELRRQARRMPLVYPLSLHPFIAGQPHRLHALLPVLDLLAEHRDEIWLTTPGAIAAHYADVVPAPTAEGNPHG
jgi:allantoinase